MTTCPYCNFSYSSALRPSSGSRGNVSFHELFDVQEVQKIQDSFSSAMGVASVITLPDGTPVTRPSNFRRLCSDIIRATEVGRRNCEYSDSVIGKRNPDGPTISTCMSGGLWDAGANIHAGDIHVANWLVGQVRNDAQHEDELLNYADEIGVCRNEFLTALNEVPVMDANQFHNIAQALFIFANKLSLIAHQNLQQAQLIAEREESRHALQEMMDSVIDVISHVTEMRDPYTAGHQRRVAELAVAIAKHLRLKKVQVANIRIAALMHDIGKMSVPAEILSKPSRLSELEMNLMKTHSLSGFEIATSAHITHPIADIIHQHHERCDGSGYPQGLRSDELLLESKILMVADVVEAMSTDRPYRAALGMDAALAEINEHAGIKFDEEVVRACHEVVNSQRFSFSL